MEKLLTVEELAEELNVPRSWVYSRTRQLGEGRIPHVRVGKYCRFDFGQVLAWLNAQQQTHQEGGPV